MINQFTIFILRWVLNSLGLWVSVRLFGTGIDIESPLSIFGFLMAGLIFSIVNAFLKPIIIILALPAILLTLGLFTIVVNGFMVWLSLIMTPGIKMSFGVSILAGMVLSLVNYIVSSIAELGYARKFDKENKEQEEGEEE